MSEFATVPYRAGARSGAFQVIRLIADIRAQVAAWRAGRERIGLVMTMGALHDGHLSLVDRCVRRNDRTIVTLFANPLQLFGDDFTHYPRQEAADIELARGRGVDVLFAPAVEEMFPDPASPAGDFLTVVMVRKLTAGLCAKARPGLYEGIATEIAKTLIMIQPDVAYFGEKDYQQLQMVRRLCADLSIPVRVEAVPTLRMDDGLAYASRNQHIPAGRRAIAPGLHRTLVATAAALQDPRRATQPLLDAARRRLLDLGFDSVDYVEVCDAEQLQPLDRVDRPARVFGAAFLGRARLVDNVPVPPAPAAR
jgi:pantoate--beta-alanine ligase